MTKTNEQLKTPYKGWKPRRHKRWIPIEAICPACGASLGSGATCMGVEEKTPTGGQSGASNEASSPYSLSRLNSENVILRETVDILEDSLSSALRERDMVEERLRLIYLKQNDLIVGQSKEIVRLSMRSVRQREQARGEF